MERRSSSPLLVGPAELGESLRALRLGSEDTVGQMTDSLARHGQLVLVGRGRERDVDEHRPGIRHGVQRKDGRLGATVLHLWHPEADRSRLDLNQRQRTAH